MDAQLAQLAQQAFNRGGSTDWERRETPFEVDAQANENQLADATNALRQERGLPRHAHC
ncbi:MAG: hypothetical protein ACO1PN_05515 [Betaproteobacteria bacterium]